MQINNAEQALLSAIMNLQQSGHAIKSSLSAASSENENTTTQQSVINDISGWLFNLEQDNELKDQVRQSWGLTDQDNVQILVIPKGERRIQPMSFVTRPSRSPRSDQLTLEISRSRSRISELNQGIADPTLTSEERAKQVGSLEQVIRDSQRALAREKSRLSNAPRSGFIVVQRDE